MRKALLGLLCTAAFAFATPASAALPEFCTNPTTAQAQNVELQQECDVMREIDASVTMLQEAMQVVQKLTNSMKDIDKSLKDAFDKALPPPKLGNGAPREPSIPSR